MRLTSHERLMRIFQNKEIDRPSLKLWGAGLDPEFAIHPAYLPVNRLALEKTDLLGGVGFPFDIYAGRNMGRYKETYTTPTDNPDWQDAHTVLHTPQGDLHMIERQSLRGEHDYIVEHMIKEPEDIDAMLSMEYEPFDFDRAGYDAAGARMGDRGVMSVDISHAGYAAQRMMGSETLAYFSVDERERLQELIRVFGQRLENHTKQILSLGIEEPVFSWVGPEVLQPPLLRPEDFEEFVHDIDKPICDLIHNAGGHVWVHSHGKVAKLIDSYIDMGVDVLNPLEPPKNGDVFMDELVAHYGNRIGWEGNIEIQELLLSSQERIRQLIDECVAAGWKSGRFILCPSAGYMEYIRPTEQYIDNLLFYLNYGYEAVERCRRD